MRQAWYATRRWRKRARSSSDVYSHGCSEPHASIHEPVPTMKRQQEDAVKSAPTNRGRGRPRKNPDAPPPSPKDPSAPKRGRGRPRKDPNASPPPKKGPMVPGRGRGRPSKAPGTFVTTPTAPDAPKDSDGSLEANSIVATTPKTANMSHLGRGRSINAGGAASPLLVLELKDIIGTYEVGCDEVVRNWPKAQSMSISISALPNTHSALVAAFSLGILEGTMLLAADKDTLERVRRQLPKPDNAGKSPTPDLKSRTVYFTWRGRSIGGDDEVHLGADGSQTGILKFKGTLDGNYNFKFKGVGSFPRLGSECGFRGVKIFGEPEEEPEPWDSFSGPF
ncbi:hypothetical protein K458DRAFT_65311 [Lentithecium fluviatile CBS 122367]|uniref:Uncharacterized protein n=1 Tax=Lentithecium fluviatile CBS 122367 TaxID=1168545 RepID=A0A6G1JLE8_9PLEO|nr:hypothetical protein K458DRAFT_65311 [Lentithecium fluviatile CBS 122367]